MIRFTTVKDLSSISCQELLNVDPEHPHIHLVDMPFRVMSTWQDRDCQAGIWEKDNKVVAYAVFQPPWQVLDFAIDPSQRGSSLEKEVFAWGKQQMSAYAKWSGEDFAGVIELYENTPNLDRSVDNLHDLGFKEMDWSVIRFALDLNQSFAKPALPDGYIIRSFRGKSEVKSYVKLVDAVFGPNWLTKEWRMRTLEHPAYRSEIDLVVENTITNQLVGYCHCWLWKDIGQIEPLGVHPDHHRKGLGSALELAALDAMKKQDACMMLVDHGSTNIQAIALSKKTGFRQINNSLRFSFDTNMGDQ